MRHTATPHESSDERRGNRDHVLGGLMIVLGVICLAAPMATGLGSVIWVGALVAASGVIEIAAGLGRRDERRRPLMLAGLLSVVAGAILIARPGVAIAALAMLLAAFLFASGLVAFLPAIRNRYAGWGWDAAFGVISAALGVLLMVSWRTGGPWLLGLAVGLEIVARGAALLGTRHALFHPLRTQDT